MTSVMQKTLLAALGAVDLSRDKIRQTVDYLVEKGKLSKQEAPKIIEDLLERGEREGEHLKKLFEELPWIATRKDTEALATRLEAIEARLSALEGR